MYNTLPGTPFIKRISDGAFIPVDPDNRDYKSYLKWVASGNKATDYVKSEEEELCDLKVKRSQNVSKIVVTVDGKAFDGDEVSQNRIARALTALDDSESTLWTLNNNEIVSVTKTQLKEALRLAGAAQTSMWDLEV